MSFFAVLLALVIEQFKPLPRDNWVHNLLVSWVRWTGRNFDAGRAHHAWVVWGVSVGAPGLLLGAVYLVIAQTNPELKSRGINVLIVDKDMPVIGAGARFDPPKWLKPGDVVEVEIGGVGTLSNTIADELVG